MEIWVRSNLKNGEAREERFSPEWWMHPGNPSGEMTDVALTSVDFASDEDFLTIPLNGPTDMAATGRLLYAHNVGVGHEVFITGLYSAINEGVGEVQNKR
jgi:hypothetical protein